MVTLKDVAKLAEVSVSTVSIVVNNKAKERSIPLKTYNKVIKAMDELGYQPNVSARRLRSLDDAKPIIALYWTMDARTNMMTSLLAGVQSEIEKRQFDCELVIRIYKNGEFEKAAKEIVNNSYNGVIVGATDQSDLDYLESLTPRMPLVLINRPSEKYSTVYVKPDEVAEEAVGLLTKRSVERIGVVGVDGPYVASTQRMHAFLQACKDQRISIAPEHFLKVPNSMAGGAAAAREYLRLPERPRTLFCESDTIVLGIVHELNRQNIRIPEEMDIMAISMAGPDSTRYASPSITTIDIPSERIASAAISMLHEALSKKKLRERLTPMHQKIAPTTYVRASFPLPSQKAGGEADA